MDRSVRYEALRSDEDLPAEPVRLAMVIPPPTMPAAAAETMVVDMQTPPPEYSQQQETEPKEENTVINPPSYNVATSLPSYEEAERSKQDQADHTAEERSRITQSGHLLDKAQLGTDGMFLCAFMIAFIFNWVGLLAALCVTSTVAGRFGALSGFGLSLVKWVFIVKHNEWASGVADNDSWVWWIFIILGFLIFFRGCIEYIRIKYQWNTLSAVVRDRVYYFQM